MYNVVQVMFRVKFWYHTENIETNLVLFRFSCFLFCFSLRKKKQGKNAHNFSFFKNLFLFFCSFFLRFFFTHSQSHQIMLRFTIDQLRKLQRNNLKLDREVVLHRIVIIHIRVHTFSFFNLLLITVKIDPKLIQENKVLFWYL